MNPQRELQRELQVADGESGTVFAPHGARVDGQSLARLRRRRLPVFGELQLEFLDELGAALRKPALRAEEGLMAAGFWLRRRHLESMRKYVESGPGVRVVPRGLVFHVAPSNADPMFVYSWALALAAGNSSLVRVSSRGSSAQSAMLAAIADVMARPRYTAISESNILATWPRESGLTREVSRVADGRVLWGSDKSIGAIRQLPCRADTMDLAFGDRIGLCAMQAAEFLALEEEARRELVSRFVRDAWAFDQRACSSPHHMVWVGDEEQGQRASSAFWPLVRQQLADHEMSPALASARMSTLYELAASQVELEVLEGGRGAGPVVIRSAPNGISELRSGGGGLFIEVSVSSLSDIAPWCRRHHQTLTHFGLPADSLDALVETLQGRSIDRVVPVGQALEFAPIWDGNDILVGLTRRVVLQ